MRGDAMEAVSDAGYPELTGLGRNLELLRVGRGLSKQRLARDAGVSRQQLWRVMTGKSDLTEALRQRLADVLRVDSRELLHGQSGFVPFSITLEPPPASRTLAAWLDDEACLGATLRSLPSGEEGRALKRALLNGIEEVATARGMRLPPAFFALRGLAFNGEL